MKKLLIVKVLLTVFILNGMAQSKRLLVVSGGGAKGAWGAGLVTYLRQQKQREYSMVIGTSTGSLMAPLILLDSLDKLKKGYTSISQDDIFNVNPFKKDGSLKTFNLLWRLVTGKKTLGESVPLKKKIREFITETEYKQLKEKKLYFAVATVNLRTKEVAYKNSRDFDYEQMVNWIWASANEPVFMSLYEENVGNTTNYWVDGGLRANIALQEAFTVAQSLQYNEIDVIVNNPIPTSDTQSKWPSNDMESKKVKIFNSLFQTFDIFNNGVRDQNIYIGKLLQELSEKQKALYSEQVKTGILSEVIMNDKIKTGILLKIYFMPDTLFKLIPNELVFDEDKMKYLWEQGNKGIYVAFPEEPEEIHITQELLIKMNLR